MHSDRFWAYEATMETPLDEVARMVILKKWHQVTPTHDCDNRQGVIHAMGILREVCKKCDLPVRLFSS
jgi:hypothetical protein